MWDQLLCIQSQIVMITGDNCHSTFFFPQVQNRTSFEPQDTSLFMRLSHVICTWKPFTNRTMLYLDFSSPAITSLRSGSRNKTRTFADSLMSCVLDEPLIRATQHTWEIVDNPSPTPQQSCRLVNNKGSGLQKGAIVITVLNDDEEMANYVMGRCTFYAFLEFFVFAQHTQYML